jgi:hypothetical protein
METDSMNDDARDPSASRGSHGDAIGWVMFKNDKMVFDVVWTDRDEAEKYCLGAYSGTAEVVGVYRQPQPVLADEERDAIWTVSEAYAENGGDPESERIATIMQGLWQRTR